MEDWLQCQISHVDKKSQNPNANPTVDTFFQLFYGSSDEIFTFFSWSMAVLMTYLPFSAGLWQFWWDIYLFQLFYGSSDEIFTFFSCSMAVLMRYLPFSVVLWQFWWDIYLFQLFYGSSDEIFGCVLFPTGPVMLSFLYLTRNV